MDWHRGLLRAWVIASLAWCVGAAVYGAGRWRQETLCATYAHSARCEERLLSYGAGKGDLDPAPAILISWALGLPLGFLGGGVALDWAVAGIRRNP